MTVNFKTKLKKIATFFYEHAIEVRSVVKFLYQSARSDRPYKKSHFPFLNKDSKYIPVVLVQGFLANRRSMHVLAHRLYNAGYSVAIFNLNLNLRDIRESAKLLSKQLATFMHENNVTKIDLLCHSMGGLVGLYYVKHLQGHEGVRKLIMMGSPVIGTPMAFIGSAFISARQVRMQSTFLRELHAGDLPANVEYITISARRDIICPPHTNRLGQVTHIELPYGHASLIMNRDVFERLKQLLN